MSRTSGGLAADGADQPAALGAGVELTHHRGGLGVAELRELRQLKDENSKLKQMVADLSLDKQMLQDVIKKKL